MYLLFGLLPPTRAGAQRLGLVTIAQMIRALVYAVEQPPTSGHQRVMNVPDIRRGAML
jgi:hypothetical protein